MATAFYGWFGWPAHGELGAAEIVGLTGVGFFAGHVIAAIANWVQPTLWGHAPGSHLSSAEGLFGSKGVWSSSDKSVRQALARSFPDAGDFESQFKLAYARAQTGALGPKMHTFVEQIGFYRSGAVACAICFLLVVMFAVAGKRHLPLTLWGPLFALSFLPSLFGSDVSGRTLAIT